MPEIKRSVLGSKKEARILERRSGVLSPPSLRVPRLNVRRQRMASDLSARKMQNEWKLLFKRIDLVARLWECFASVRELTESRRFIIDVSVRICLDCSCSLR